MRIISGSARGRKLAPPPQRNVNIRPTSDRAREALFNILGSRVEGSKVLDLFAGTGALALEAFSRGAARVIMVENHHAALNLIRKNLQIFPPEAVSRQIAVIRHDLSKGLPRELFRHEQNLPFDLIFLDPPYSKGLSLKILEWLGNQRSLLADDVLIVAEERSSEKLPNKQSILGLSDQRTYGDTGFWFYSLL